jgi:hypothetical protein
MNRYNFLQTGGFPFETDILDGMQKAFEIFNCLGALAGPLTIISGCVVTGSTVSNGFVHIDGEIYPFIGGTIQTNVIFQTVTQSAEFEDLTTKDIQIKKTVQFGTGVGSMLWADFKRPETTTQLTNLIESLTERVVDLEALPAYENKIKNLGYFSGLDINGSSGTLPVSGDISSAVCSVLGANGLGHGSAKILVTLANAMTNTNYLPKMYVQSGSASIANDLRTCVPVFKIISTTQFEIGLAETQGIVDSLKIHIEVEQL